jgi:hypothetical protein
LGFLGVVIFWIWSIIGELVGQIPFSSDITIYALAILALLGLWLFHQMQVRSGRIQAVDLFDRSVVRFYVYVIPDESPVCEVCAQAQGRAFLSSLVEKKGFSPLEERCKGTVPCQGYLIGLYGGWVEARDVVARLQHIPKKTVMRLSREELCAVVKGEWNRSVSADTDRINIHMLEGLCFEKGDMNLAIAGYRYVIERAKEDRHRSLVVPAYLRLIGLLLRAGSADEARQAIQQFEKRFPPNQSDPAAPTTLQRKALEEMKSLLWESQSLQVSA